MPTFNYPESNEQPTADAPKPPKKDFRNVIYALLTVGLLGSLAYIWFNRKTEKENNLRQQQQLSTQITKTDDAEQNYKAALVQLDSMTILNTSKDAVITEGNNSINRLKMEAKEAYDRYIASGKKDKMAYATLQSKVDQLYKEIAGYKERVAQLEQENQALTSENTTVKSERDQIKTDLESTKSDLENTKTTKKELEEKVDIGSTLVAGNFFIQGINEKKGGKEKTTSTAKRVDKLRISFSLGANRITPTGKKTIYVCITAPDGTPVTVPALGSGKMTSRNEGEKFFTTSLDVDYTQGETKAINFDWKQDSDFQRGDYKVEVYQNGFKIGEGKATLKKGGLFG
jgi:regulator of replication initiation timing